MKGSLTLNGLHCSEMQVDHILIFRDGSVPHSLTHDLQSSFALDLTLTRQVPKDIFDPFSLLATSDRILESVIMPETRAAAKRRLSETTFLPETRAAAKRRLSETTFLEEADGTFPVLISFHESFY